MGESDGEGDGVPDGDGDGEGDGVPEGDGDGDGDGEGVPDGDGDGEGWVRFASELKNACLVVVLIVQLIGGDWKPSQ